LRAPDRRAAAAALLVALAACAHRQAPPPGAPEQPGPAPPPVGPGTQGEAPPGVEIGLATFYGGAFQGRRTASGARYDGRALTCAHRTAPFGTRLRVTNLETGESVVVTVNDRGPFAGRNRIVDLSHEAARRLGILARGVARVRVEVVEPPGPSAAPPVAPGS
jgi:rare lipoprotein A